MGRMFTLQVRTRQIDQLALMHAADAIFRSRATPSACHVHLALDPHTASLAEEMVRLREYHVVNVPFQSHSANITAL